MINTQGSRQVHEALDFRFALLVVRPRQAFSRVSQDPEGVVASVCLPSNLVQTATCFLVDRATSVSICLTWIQSLASHVYVAAGPHFACHDI